VLSLLQYTYTAEKNIVVYVMVIETGYSQK